MIEITKEQANYLEFCGDIGHYSEHGAVIGDAKWIIVYKDNDIYLAHESDFEVDGVFVRLKEDNQ